MTSEVPRLPPTLRAPKARGGGAQRSPGVTDGKNRRPTAPSVFGRQCSGDVQMVGRFGRGGVDAHARDHERMEEGECSPRSDDLPPSWMDGSGRVPHHHAGGDETQQQRQGSPRHGDS